MLFGRHWYHALPVCKILQEENTALYLARSNVMHANCCSFSDALSISSDRTHAPLSCNKRTIGVDADRNANVVAEHRYRFCHRALQHRFRHNLNLRLKRPNRFLACSQCA